MIRIEHQRSNSTSERIHMGRIAETAEKRFIEGFSCSQSVFSAFAEAEGIDLETALRIASSFGAGMARMGDTCGAVTGGMMVLGLKYGRAVANDDEAKEKNYRLVHEFVDRFNKRFEHSICRDLLGFDPGSPEASQRFKDDPELERRCAGFVREAAEIIEEITARESEQSRKPR
jgi:C_GCAxxG_C_C family probable redox protein